jgi:hypothetical protein
MKVREAQNRPAKIKLGPGLVWRPALCKPKGGREKKGEESDVHLPQPPQKISDSI